MPFTVVHSDQPVTIPSYLTIDKKRKEQYSKEDYLSSYSLIPKYPTGASK